MTVCMGYPAMTLRGEPENAAGKGQEHHVDENGRNTNRFLKGDFAYEEKQV